MLTAAVNISRKTKDVKILRIQKEGRGNLRRPEQLVKMGATAFSIEEEWREKRKIVQEACDHLHEMAPL